MYAPVKEEEEWDEPRIIRYHDVVSDREIELLKSLSRPWVNMPQTSQSFSIRFPFRHPSSFRGHTVAIEVKKTERKK